MEKSTSPGTDGQCSPSAASAFANTAWFLVNQLAAMYPQSAGLPEPNHFHVVRFAMVGLLQKSKILITSHRSTRLSIILLCCLPYSLTKTISKCVNQFYTHKSLRRKREMTGIKRMSNSFWIIKSTFGRINFVGGTELLLLVLLIASCLMMNGIIINYVQAQYISFYE